MTPEKLPVHVLGMFTDRRADTVTDRLYAKCLVLDDGAERLALVVVDSCMMPRDLLDRAKELARERTGLRADRIMISATHTHSAPAAMGALGTPPDAAYVQFLPGRIAEAVACAAQQLVPARIGWAVVKDYAHTHCRRWIRRPDAIGQDPFGEWTVRANMHPGHEDPEAIGPAGPVDPDLSVLAVQGRDGRPIALLANYAMHYYDSVPISADYFGRFAEKITRMIGAENAQPPFVAMMSQGTSGDQMWMDYAAPRNDPGLDRYAEEVAQVAFSAYRSIRYHDWVPLKMAEARLTLGFRLCDEKRLAWAKQIVAEMRGRLPQTLPEVYACEQLYLHARPVAELKLQAIRIGALGVAAWPNEVFAISGLKLKAHSPLQPTINIELANGAEGYIPPPEQHRLGGYTTWAARTAGLEVNAEPKIVEKLLQLLEQVSGRRRRQPVDTPGEYAQAILASQPAAYWRLGEFNGPVAKDFSGHGRSALYEGTIAFYLDGPQSPAFSGSGVANRCVHLAGGLLLAPEPKLGKRYTVEFWFWNGLPTDLRAMTGWLFAQADSVKLGILGTNGTSGRLALAFGRTTDPGAFGRTPILPKTWHHVALIRSGEEFTVYLDGQPEISMVAEPRIATEAGPATFGGLNVAAGPTLEGKLDEVAIYKRELETSAIVRHYQQSRMRAAALEDGRRNR